MAGAFLVMLLSVATHVVWLSWAGFALLFTSLLLSPLASLQDERERRGARARDKALGLPVARNLMRPMLLAVCTVVGGLVVGFAVMVVGFVIIQSMFQRGSLTWGQVQDDREAVFAVGFVIMAAPVLASVPLYFLQKFRRTQEDRRVDRERGELA